MSRPLVADDFDAIRARMLELEAAREVAAGGCSCVFSGMTGEIVSRHSLCPVHGGQMVGQGEMRVDDATGTVLVREGNSWVELRGIDDG